MEDVDEQRSDRWDAADRKDDPHLNGCPDDGDGCVVGEIRAGKWAVEIVGANGRANGGSSELVSFEYIKGRIVATDIRPRPMSTHRPTFILSFMLRFQMMVTG